MFKEIIWIFAICELATAKSITGRIFEGDLVQSETIYPFAVSITSFVGDRQEYSTGSIITSRAILTAATGLESAEYVDIGYGSHLKSSQSIQRVGPSNIIVYPKYNSQYSTHNIAIVRLPVDIAFSLAVQPIQLPRLSNAVVDYFSTKQATLMGWGTYNMEQIYLSNFLRRTTVQIIKNADCAKIYTSGAVIESSMCSMGYLDPKHNACFGDGGAPLIVQEAGLWIQIGVVSFSRECPTANPTGYTSVAFYLNWISQTTGIVVRE